MTTSVLGDRDLFRRARDRERARHDVTPHLVEFALDPAETRRSRQQALELLARLGRREVIGDLAPLLHDPDEVVRAYAAATIAELE